MNPCRVFGLALAALCSLGIAPAAVAAGCKAQSGEQRAVLLELYTSEGCDSCPPADRRLSAFKGQAGFAGRLVPLAFHVDYWDRLGWADRYASPQHSRRQYAMAALAGARLVYTPQFLRNGRDWRKGGSPLDGPADTPPQARIDLELTVAGVASLAVTGMISTGKRAAEAWLAVYENDLVSEVRAGENAGRTLRHDSVVRRLIGPLAFDAGGRLVLRQEIALEPGWKPRDLGVAAFVQDSASGEILQALQRHACAP